MAEFSNSNTVSVAAGENLPLTETAVKAPVCIMHREGSGLVTLRGLTNQCKARFKVSFGGNIAIPTGGTVGSVSVALAAVRHSIAQPPLSRLLQSKTTSMFSWPLSSRCRAAAA